MTTDSSSEVRCRQRSRAALLLPAAQSSTVSINHTASRGSPFGDLISGMHLRQVLASSTLPPSSKSVFDHIQSFFSSTMPDMNRSNHEHYSTTGQVFIRSHKQDPGICCQMSDPKRPNFGTYVRTIFRRFRPQFGSYLSFWTISVRNTYRTCKCSRSVHIEDERWNLGQNVRIKQK